MIKFRSIYATLIGGKIYNINGKTIREEKLISEGAYSFVYMAKDLNTNKSFTLKKTICQDKEKLEMANKEINILKSLPPHKNIVQYYGSTVVSENNYKIVIMLMEYCERGNLLNIFEKNKEKIREQHIVKIMKDIITGLSFLHNQEIPITHRDIKLENILCDKRGVYKICDFGSHTVSKSIYPNDLMKNALRVLKEEIERDTTLMYRPPELIDLYSNLEISCKVDIWMVGCILYLLLFKVHPFQNNSFLSILNGSFTIPYNRKYSKRIISVLLMTLNKNPLKRVDSSTLLFILENYSDLKKWFGHIPNDIKKKVNQIFDKINENNINDTENNVIEINNDKIIDMKVITQKGETQSSKNNINFLKFFSQNNLGSNALKKNLTTNGSENVLIHNKKNESIEKKENTDSINNIKDSKDVNNCKEHKKLEENAESKLENKTVNTEVKDIKETKRSSNININIIDSKENYNLLNLENECEEVVEKSSIPIIYNNENILKDLSLNDDVNLFDFKNDTLNKDQNNYNNFDNFFDPWNNEKNDDLIGVDKFIHKNSNNDLFEDDLNYPFNNDLFYKDPSYEKNRDFIKDNINEIFKDTCFMNNCGNNLEHLNYQNSTNINNTCNNINYFKEIQNKEINKNFDSMLKEEIVIDSENHSKNCMLSDINKNTSQLIIPDKNDKFSELLDDFQNFSIQ